MMPNKDKSKFIDSILFECECAGGGHFLRASSWNDEDTDIWFTFLDKPSSLWTVLRIWWKQRYVTFSAIQLTLKDAEALRDKLTEFLEKQNKQPKPKFKVGEKVYWTENKITYPPVKSVQVEIGEVLYMLKGNNKPHDEEWVYKLLKENKFVPEKELSKYKK